MKFWCGFLLRQWFCTWSMLKFYSKLPRVFYSLPYLIITSALWHRYHCMPACQVGSVASDSSRPLWTVGHQASLSLGFSRQEYWSGFHALLQRIWATGGSPVGIITLYFIDEVKIKKTQKGKGSCRQSQLVSTVRAEWRSPWPQSHLPNFPRKLILSFKIHLVAISS